MHNVQVHAHIHVSTCAYLYMCTDARGNSYA